MTITTIRIAPGVYRAEVNGVRYGIVQLPSGTAWLVSIESGPSPGRIVGDPQKTKKAAVSVLEIHARQTKDRTKSSTHKIPRRSELTKGTELSLVPRSVPGVRGRVKFLGYTRTNSNVEWLDVVDSNGRSRAVDPAKVKTVHRDRKMP